MLFIGPDNAYPRHIGDLQLAHPDWVEGAPLPAGWQEVKYADALPEVGPDEVLQELFPALKDGVLVQSFATRPMTEEELERRDAPERAKQKLAALGLTELELESLIRSLSN